MFTDVAEFHSIGLRPMEYRTGVIRRAMSRSAVPLANLHLSQPNGDVEAKLARIVMTGYRLLDPRRREDSIQRMMLGRIHPQLAYEVARMAQAQANQGMLGQGFEGEEPILERSLISSSLPRGGRREHHYFLHDTISESLRSHDLLIERPIQRAVRITKRWVTRKYVAAGAVLGCMLLSLFAWRAIRPETAPTTNQQLPQTAQPSSIAENGNAKETQIVTVPLVTRVEPSTAASTEPGASNKTVATPIVPVRIASETVAPVPTVPQTIAEVTLPEVIHANAMAETSTSPSTSEQTNKSLLQSEAEEAALEAAIPTIEAPSPLLPPYAVVAVPNANAAAPALDASVNAIAKVSVPSDRELASVIVQWETTLQGLLPNDWNSRQKRSIGFAEDIGTINGKQESAVRTWVGLLAATRFAVLQGNLVEADQLIQRLTDAYEIDKFSLAINIGEQLVLDQSVSTVSTLTSAIQTIDWLEVWVGRSLLAARFPEAQGFASSLEQIAKATDNKAAVNRVDELQNSIDIATRLLVTVLQQDEAQSQPTNAIEIGPSDHYAIGRYWALVRRDWAKALPHLRGASELRLANVASAELRLNELSKPEELITIASDYLAIAQKSAGWLRDSYILHAHEILQRNVTAGSNASMLELNRYQKQFEHDHAQTLTAAERLLPSPRRVEQAMAIAEVKPAIKSVAANENGLVGRIQVDGADVGVELSYEPGARLTRKAFEQIASHLDLNLTGAIIKLSGVVTLDQPTAMVVHLADLPEQKSQSFWIADQELYPSSESLAGGRDEVAYRVDLPAGQWTLRWLAPVMSEKDLTFRVRDGLSGLPITVKSPVATTELTGPPLLTRLRTTVITGQ